MRQPENAAAIARLLHRDSFAKAAKPGEKTTIQQVASLSPTLQASAGKLGITDDDSAREVVEGMLGAKPVGEADDTWGSVLHALANRLRRGKGKKQLERVAQQAEQERLAAAIEALDLVLSVDTSVVHLAGALGTPVWTLLPQRADWRWLTGRDDTPWYPSMRLFRQAPGGGWDGVIDAVAAALALEPERQPGR